MKVITITIAGGQGTGKTMLAKAIGELLAEQGISLALSADVYGVLDGAIEQLNNFPVETRVRIETEQT